MIIALVRMAILMTTTLFLVLFIAAYSESRDVDVDSQIRALKDVKQLLQLDHLADKIEAESILHISDTEVKETWYGDDVVLDTTSSPYFRYVEVGQRWNETSFRFCPSLETIKSVFGGKYGAMIGSTHPAIGQQPDIIYKMGVQTVIFSPLYGMKREQCLAKVKMFKGGFDG